MPILEIITLLQAAIVAAPKVVEIAVNGKNLINSMVAAKPITIEEQKRVDDFVSGVDAIAASGQLPAHWQVEADPS